MSTIMSTDQREKQPRPKGMELSEVTPLMLGGDPVDPRNKIWLTRQQHFEAVRYWNRIIRELREQTKT